MESLQSDCGLRNKAGSTVGGEAVMVRECRWSGWDGGGRWVANLEQAGGSVRGVGDLPRGRFFFG